MHDEKVVDGLEIVFEIRGRSIDNQIPGIVQLRRIEISLVAISIINVMVVVLIDRWRVIVNV